VKVLLDTHIWLWSHLEPERLSKKVRTILLAPESELWLSSISVWEFLLLAEKRPVDWLNRAWSRAPIREAPLNREIMIGSRSVRLPHEDPADRFIVATAQLLDLTLITADDKLLRGRGFRTLANQ
jgi:PIN domain nuclease of toxin-antitoxin system